MLGLPLLSYFLCAFLAHIYWDSPFGTVVYVDWTSSSWKFWFNTIVHIYGLECYMSIHLYNMYWLNWYSKHFLFFDSASLLRTYHFYYLPLMEIRFLWALMWELVTLIELWFNIHDSNALYSPILNKTLVINILCSEWVLLSTFTWM